MSDPFSKYLDNLLGNNKDKKVKLGLEITIKGIYQLILSLLIITIVLTVGLFIPDKIIFIILYILTFLSATLGIIFTSLVLSTDELWNSTNQNIKYQIYPLLCFFILVYFILGIFLYKKMQNIVPK